MSPLTSRLFNTHEVPSHLQLCGVSHQALTRLSGHVAQDLCGYVCVFEDCESPEDMFASTYEWMSHMARFHSEVEWVCPLCAKQPLPDAADDVEAASFPDPSQLKDHILACHPAIKAAADLTELELVVSAGQRTVGIRKVRCPLCRPGLVTSEEGIDGCAVPHLAVGQMEGLVQLEEDQHVATHIHEFALHLSRRQMATSYRGKRGSPFRPSEAPAWMSTLRGRGLSKIRSMVRSSHTP